MWVAEVEDREALVRLIRAALSGGVAPVAMGETHLTSGVHTLQIRLQGEPVVVLAAELAGETATGSFALRLEPLDPSHIPELVAIAEHDGDDLPESSGPMSARASAIFDSEPPLAPPGRRFTTTLPDPEPEEVDSEDLEASVLFDPEAALISKAPPRPDGTGPDDTLTIPVRASMMPPGHAVPGAQAAPAAQRVAPPAAPRTASGPRPISHLSIPTTAPTTERHGSPEAVATPRSAVDAHAVTERHGSMPEHTLSITVDFETSASNVSTARQGGWSSDDGPDAVDPSLGESVVFDPDVLAREQRTDTSDKPPRRPAGVIASRHDDASLTPTAPMDLPARSPSLHRSSVRREPSVRIDPRSEDFGADEEAERSPRQSTDAPSNGAISSGRGPRTQKRTVTSEIVAPGRIIANRYRIESLVGAGAVGAVYKAVHVDLPRTFAIKMLHPHYRADAQLMASFRTEARAASLLDHPNVTVVHDFGEEPDGLVYIVMEFLAGKNLQAILDEERRIAPRRAIQILLQVCGALAAAHERGIVHRDVKPDNIMLVPVRDDEGRPHEVAKVCDFGIAALETAPHEADPEWTAGTPEYMAPELAQGRADARADVYACGIVLYEMLTGRPPFVGDTPMATVAKHASEMARPPSELVPGIPPSLEAVIMRAIEKAPDRRFATMRELRVELKRLL